MNESSTGAGQLEVFDRIHKAAKELAIELDEWKNAGGSSEAVAAKILDLITDAIEVSL